MPSPELMTWVPSQRRWTIQYMGRRYYVSCRQLGIKPETKQESVMAANAWWRDKQASIDHAYRENQHAARRVPQPTEDLGSALLGSNAADFPAALTAFLRSVVSSQPGIEPMVADIPAAPVDEDTASIVLRQAVLDLLGKVIFDGQPFPEQLAKFLPPARAAQVGRAVKELRGESAADPSKTVGAMMDQWLLAQKTQVAIGGITAAHYRIVGKQLSHFAAFIGETADVSAMDAGALEGFYNFCLSRLADRRWSRPYAGRVFAVARQWVGWLAERGSIPLPTNFRRKWRFGPASTQIKTWTVDEVQKIVGRATGKLKLCLLLCLNCGMTQKDVSDLRDTEVDWPEGRIVRKRSKTGLLGSTPIVNYRLWPETFRLLKQYRSGQERVLLTDSGRPYVQSRMVEDKCRSVDCFRALFHKLTKKIGTHRSMKLLRKTAASLLESHETYGRFTSLFLGHAPASMKDRHYAAPPQALFDAAVQWLGEQLGLAGEV